MLISVRDGTLMDSVRKIINCFVGAAKDLEVDVVTAAIDGFITYAIESD